MRKRSFLLGVSAGIAVKVLFTVVVTVALVGIAQVHDATREWATLLQDKRLPALSAGWVASQCLVVLGAVLSGAACAHWSKPGTWAAPLVVALLWLAWSVFKLPEGMQAGLAVFRVSVSSVGILLGALAYRHWSGRTTAAPAGPTRTDTR